MLVVCVVGFKNLDMTCSRSKLQGQLIVSRSHRSIARWLNVAKGVKKQVDHFTPTSLNWEVKLGRRPAIETFRGGCKIRRPIRGPYLLNLYYSLRRWIKEFT
jgi:hypothetical protein